MTIHGITRSGKARRPTGRRGLKVLSGSTVETRKTTRKLTGDLFASAPVRQLEENNKRHRGRATYQRLGWPPTGMMRSLRRGLVPALTAQRELGSWVGVPAPLPRRDRFWMACCLSMISRSSGTRGGRSRQRPMVTFRLDLQQASPGCAGDGQVGREFGRTGWSCSMMRPTRA
jgi:hypothetical protein